MIGEKFGRLTVLERVDVENSHIYYLCECDCGKKKVVAKSSLINGDSKSCGCLNRELTINRNKLNSYKLDDLTGKKFGKLTVIKREGTNKSNHVTWLCSCDCGNTKITTSLSLKRGEGLHCGCSKPKPKTKHNMTNTRIYEIWESMKQRCLNEKHPSFNRYGGRGITICDEWLDFENFYNDMIESYSKELTIDRIDNNKGYYKENCRWATKTEQSINRNATKHLFYYNDREMCISEILKNHNPIGISRNGFMDRYYKRGMSLEEALTTPLNNK